MVTTSYYQPIAANLALWSLTVFALAIFAAFIWGVRRHFVSERMPIEMMLVSVLSLVTFSVFLQQLWFNSPPTLLAVVVSCALLFSSIFLFLWSVKASSKSRLRLAFDSGSPQSLIDVGPYRIFRHPFYVSYILFWIGCAVATRSLICTVLAIALTATYFVAAKREEALFLNSERAADYNQYRKRVGSFWPKLWSGSA